MITNPKLPPKAGYVEVVDSEGNHIYKATPETEAKLAKEAEQKNISDILNTLLGVNE